MPYEANMIPVSIPMMTELLEKATRYDVIRNSILANIRRGKTYNIVDSELIRLLTETVNIENDVPIGAPEEDDGK